MYNKVSYERNKKQHTVSVMVARRNSPRYTLNYALYRALKRRPTSNPATADDLMTLWYRQNGLCAVSGRAMTWGGGKGKVLSTSVTVDRISSSKGYSLNNIQLVCYAVNSFKGEMTNGDVLEWAADIVEHLSRKKDS